MGEIYIRRSPTPSIVGWVVGHPLPIPHLLDAFGVSPTVPHHFSKPAAASVWSHRMHRNRTDAAYCYKRRTFRGLRVYVRVCMR